jgi:hypothetical protein
LLKILAEGKTVDEDEFDEIRKQPENESEEFAEQSEDDDGEDFREPSEDENRMDCD